MFNQYLVYLVLVLTLVFFIWGRLRYDVVALLSLLSLTVVGVIPGDEAFTGFSHPAVITVAAVLILSRGLMNSGVVDSISRGMSRINKNQTLQLGVLVGAVTVCSAFMNNIGALALFMPVAIRMARKGSRSPSIYLMPLAFGSLLGGLMTQIGTPPNIVISIFREETVVGKPFGMFDFTPVGAGVALIGLIFIVFLGWRLIPCRQGRVSQEDLFEIDSYLTEVYVPEGSKFAGKRLLDLGQVSDGAVVVVGHVRNKRKLPFFSPYRVFEKGDHIILQANAEDLTEFLDVTGLKLTASKKLSEADLSSDEISIVEAVVTTNSILEGQTVRSLNLRSIYGINLLGISREGARLSARPDRVRFRAGDVLLLQGRLEALREVMTTLGCLPLVERGLKLGKPRRYLPAATIFAAALVLTVAGLLPIQVAFTAAAVVMLLAGFVSLRELYESIDWPVIILLGAMIPVSRALETTGGAKAIGDAIYHASGSMTSVTVLMIILVITMLLSNVVNNAAAALLMAPIALSIAAGMAVSAEPFLMTVAIGASSAFLTPIGHQSNTLVMGPGGYHFGDYWRMGLPLSILIILVAVPLIMFVWPL
ncbi:MAG: SLC13 family permease [Firmicutes bacterium]|nr:SLC13 family permease [Bacillota bacterium]